MIVFSTLLASCNSPGGQFARPVLPAPPANFGKPVALPVAKKGKSVRVFALQNRLGLIEADQRLIQDKAFQEDVWGSFGR
jgi:hypothetical protein